MGTNYYSLQRIPDLTLAQYSAEESGGVNDVVHKHTAFYRQLNRKGLLFNEVYHFVYLYNPDRQPGQRMQFFFLADGNPEGNGPACMDQFMEATPLAAYFQFESITAEKIPEFYQTFKYRAFLAKLDSLVPSSKADSEMKFYTVNPWKPNEKGRLIGLFRMMQKLGHASAYVVTMQAIDRSSLMRERFGPQIQYIKSIQKQTPGVKDDNADQCLKTYDKLFENLRNNPHFRCSITAYADDPNEAKMIVDAAASEAVEEGNYNIYLKAGTFCPLRAEREIPVLCIQDTPREMREWNTLYFLKELAPFATLPVLYPGETIEIPKESAPVYEKQGLYLGKDNNGYDVYMPLKLLPKHALLAGVPGSGKTYSMLHISSELAKKENNIPILVLEPAKKEYRALAYNPELPDLTVFSPGATGYFPLRINPFEFAIGVKLSEHITALNQVFEGAFDLQPPMPFLVSEAIDKVYRDHGWYQFEANDGKHTYPSIQELYDKIAILLDASDYAPDIKSNLKSCLQVRIGSLITREMGNVFNVSGSTLKPEEWLQKKCVIELESLGPDAANFLTLLLLTLIRELLRQNPNASKEKPRHVIFLEEAHNLIGPTTVANAANGDAKVASTKYIVDMLAEVRALREAIIIADQLPTGLAPQVTKNTSLKIGHRITAMDDRQLLASTMSADGVQLERMASFQPGHALCAYENVQKPFEIQISEYKEKSDSPDNFTLYTLLKGRSDYLQFMERDQIIMEEKFRTKKVKILQELERIKKNEVVYQNGEKKKDQLSENDRLKLATQKIQIERWAKELAFSWTEMVLEHIHYYGINRVRFNPDGRVSVLEDVNDLQIFLNKYLPDDKTTFINQIKNGFVILTGKTTT